MFCLFVIDNFYSFAAFLKKNCLKFLRLARVFAEICANAILWYTLVTNDVNGLMIEDHGRLGKGSITARHIDTGRVGCPRKTLYRFKSTLGTLLCQN